MILYETILFLQNEVKVLYWDHIHYIDALVDLIILVIGGNIGGTTLQKYERCIAITLLFIIHDPCMPDLSLGCKIWIALVTKNVGLLLLTQQ
jgi:cation transporter-like permease